MAYSKYDKQPERSGLYELMAASEVGILQKGVRRYLFTRNYERSLRLHKAIGTPVMRKVIMGTVGRVIKPFTGGNYRLNKHLGKMESAANFAVRGSVFNEAWHTLVAVPQITELMSEVASGNPDIATFNTAALAINLGCVAVQRYNRARISAYLDRQLQKGKEFDPAYKNWLGIDYRAQHTSNETEESIGGADELWLSNIDMYQPQNSEYSSHYVTGRT